MQIGSQLTEVKRYGHTIFLAYFASHSDLDAQADKQTDSVECSDTWNSWMQLCKHMEVVGNWNACEFLVVLELR